MKKSTFCKKSMANILVGIMTLSLAGCGGKIVEEDVTRTSEPTTQATNGVNDENIDNVNLYNKEIRAQDDFYGYVNKDTILSYTLDYNDSGAGYMYDIQDEIDKEIYTMLESIVNSGEVYEKGSNQWIVRETYQQINDYLKDKKALRKAIIWNLWNGKFN